MQSFPAVGELNSVSVPFILFSAALAFAPFVLAQNRPDSLKTFGGGSTIDAAGAKIPAGWPLYVTAGTTAGMNGG